VRATWTHKAEYDAALGSSDRAVVDCWVEDQFGRRAWQWINVAEQTFEVVGVAATYRVRIGGSAGEKWVIEELTVAGAKCV
jgi:hypothetical protein